MSVNVKRFKAYTNFSYGFLRRRFGEGRFKLLDIGAGNRSATKTTAVFPHCEYYGLDITRDYNYQDSDFKIMRDFYEIDLTKLDYTTIPDEYFDAIWMVHVIEHLHNGDEVLKRLLSKLKPGGYFYIEYPGPKSTTLPSMYGTLNFYDDPTHVRLYDVAELSGIFRTNNCEVLKSGTRRNWVYVLGMPLRILGSVVRGKRVQANIFWDILGFAEFLFVRKRK